MTNRFIIVLLAISFLTGCDLHSAQYYVERGHEIGLTGDYPSAIKLFDKAIRKNPKLKEAYIQRGLANESINQTDKAINDYTKLLTFDPQNTMAYYSIGLCKYQQQKFNEAIEYYNKALVTKGVKDPLDNSNPQIIINWNKNGLLTDIGQYDVASYEIYYERGLAYYSTNQIKRAYYDFENCIQQNYMLGESNYMVGLCWLTDKNNEKACESFKTGAFYGDSLSKVQILEICK